MAVQAARNASRRDRDGGLTLVELIVVVAIVAIMATAAYPIARFRVRRAKEQALRYDLKLMRGAIDKYKDAANKGAMEVKSETFGYPPDLQTLVDGVDVGDEKLTFLREIPVDPMTGKADWNMSAVQDDPDSSTSGDQDVYDVHSKSDRVGSDGRKYSEW